MIYDFAGFSLDIARMELRRGQDVLALEPRAFQLLRLLVEYLIASLQKTTSPTLSGRMLM